MQSSEDLAEFRNVSVYELGFERPIYHIAPCVQLGVLGNNVCAWGLV